MSGFSRTGSPAAQAKAAAGDRDVLVHGANAVQQALEAGVLDEIQIHQVPVLLGAGRRLFDILPSRIELGIVQVIDTPQATGSGPAPTTHLAVSIDLTCPHPRVQTTH